MELEHCSMSNSQYFCPLLGGLNPTLKNIQWNRVRALRRWAEKKIPVCLPSLTRATRFLKSLEVRALTHTTRWTAVCSMTRQPSTATPAPMMETITTHTTLTGMHVDLCVRACMSLQLDHWDVIDRLDSLASSAGSPCAVGMGNILMLLYIVILRAHDNRIVVVLQLSSYRPHIISGAY